MTGSDLLPWITIGGLGLLGVGLVYFIFLGVRAIYRDARRKALEAGHRQGGARLRAILRMTVWALFFGAFYFFLYFLGRRFEAWAVAPAAVGLAALIWALLQADRLLTISANNVRDHLHIGATIAAVLGAFISVILYTAQGN